MKPERQLLAGDQPLWPGRPDTPARPGRGADLKPRTRALASVVVLGLSTSFTLAVPPVVAGHLRRRYSRRFFLIEDGARVKEPIEMAQKNPAAEAR